MTLTAQELYQNEVIRLPLSERFRLMALLLEDLQNLPSPPQPPQTSVEATRPRPKRGSAKEDISYIADDFDAPLEEMREYSE